MNRIAFVLVAAALAVGCGKKNNDENNGADTGMTETDMGGPNNAVDMADPNNGTPDMADPVDMRREPPTCGPFNAVAEYVEADETGAFYYADSALAVPYDSLGIEIYDEPPTADNFTLGENYETCAQCVLIYAGCTEDSCSKIFLATSGSLDITAIGNEGDRFTGSLTNVQLEEVTINGDTFVSTPVAGGELRCIDSYEFDIFIGTTCTAVGEECDLGRAVEDPNFACVDDGSGFGICEAFTPLALPEICTNTTFAGQIGGDGLHDGGAYTDVAYTNDAGLQAVYDAIPAGVDAVTDLTATPVAVTGAIVTATNFDANANWNFWVQDVNVGIQVRLTDGAGTGVPVGMDVKVGQAVSFSVTMVETFSGHPQIKEITGFTIDSADNDVYVMEKYDADITAADYGKLVRVGGVLGAPAACGGTSMCYPMTHGAASDKMVEFRSSSMFVAETDCAVYVGPVGAATGPKDAGGLMTPRVDTSNFDWMLVP